MKEMQDCLFCKLLTGELEVSMVYQDHYCSAFMDIQPINAGHMLVVPNRHATDLAELKEEDGAQMFRVAHRLAKILTIGVLKCEGINFFLADGEAAGQEVFHVHLHVFPRYAGDGFGFRLPPRYSQMPDRRELNVLADKIRSHLEKE